MANVMFITQGCAVNQADTETMMGILSAHGHTLTADQQDADIVIINSCTVKGPTESAFWRKLKSLDRKVIIAGCIPQSEPEDRRLADYSLVGPFQIGRINEAVQETLSGGRVRFLDSSDASGRPEEKVRLNSVVEIVPIAQGCLGAPCSYCKVKSARGRLSSRPVEEIVQQVRAGVAGGAREVWLTAQDSGCYGHDIGSDILKLLDAVLSVEGEFMVRLGMGNPNHFGRYADGLAGFLNHPKMFSFVHMPVQSGNDRILRLMRRGYSCSEFEASVRGLRERVPDLTLSTDIICGFPTETDEEFEESLELIRRIRPGVLNISRFWPRPGTEAAGMEQLQGAVVKARSTALTRIFSEISEEDNRRWKGWEGDVIIDELGKDGSMVGRNKHYKPVIIKTTDESLLGSSVRVRVHTTTAHDLRADKV